MDENNKITEKESKLFYIMKFFFIFSVITAHVCNVVDIIFLKKLISYFWKLFGTVGVIGFFILGGFFYKRKDGDDKEFWKRKSVSIIIPWLVCSFLNYVIKCIADKRINIGEYLKWTIGYESLYYYVTIFLFFLFIFKYFYKCDLALYVCVGITIASLALYTFHIDYLFFIQGSKYLNPLNWIGYFASGILFRKYRIDRLLLKSFWTLIFSLLLGIVAFLILWKLGVDSYFHIATPIWGISFFILFLWISNWIAELKIGKAFEKMGKWSYCIYLIHMRIVQFSLSRFPTTTFGLIIKPLIGLAIMEIVMLFIHWGAKLIKAEKALFLIGLNAEK